LNKQIAADLGLSEVTVKLHRANAMRKMRATSLAHLVKMLAHFDSATAQVAKLSDPFNSAT
jgi:FixJ family two-component response regulator